MIVRFLEDDEFVWWDSFVDKSTQGFLFSKSWWLNIGTKSDFKICICEGDGEILAGLPLPFFSTGNIKMTPLTQSLGLLFYHKADIKLQKRLTNEKEYTNLIWDFIKDNINNFIINFHYTYNYWSPLYWSKFNQTTRYTYLINYETFNLKIHFSSLSKGHKWTINKINKSNSLHVLEMNDVDLFYNFMCKTYQRQNLSISYSFDYFNTIHKEILKNDSGIMFQALDDEGNIHAVCYIIYNHKEAYYFLGGSDVEYRNSGAHTMLIWNSIVHFQDKVKIFNFGGSMIEEVDKNFRNFSAVPNPYYVITKKSKIELCKDILKNFKAILNVR